MLLTLCLTFAAGFGAGVYGAFVAIGALTTTAKAVPVVRSGMLLERPAPFPLVWMPSFDEAEADHLLRLVMLRGRLPVREVAQ